MKSKWRMAAKKWRKVKTWRRRPIISGIWHQRWPYQRKRNNGSWRNSVAASRNVAAWRNISGSAGVSISSVSK